MFLLKRDISSKTRAYVEYSWDIIHNQKVIESITYKQRSSLFAEMSRLMKLLARIGMKNKLREATSPFQYHNQT